jgi:hypothetical protein
MTNTAVASQKPPPLDKPNLGIPENLNLAPFSDSSHRERGKPG